MDETLKFAVVREDARTLLAVLQHSGARRPLLVASGGCTALAVHARLRHVDVVALDSNRAQLDHVRAKESAWRGPGSDAAARAFNVGDASPSGLSECGSFESLFRQWRGYLDEFVLPRERRQLLFEDADSLAAGRAELLSAPRWSAAFETCFADERLVAMFGAAATQHAERGSYADWFRRAFERGLAREDALRNPFLHHIFLGRYRTSRDCLPDFLADPPRNEPLPLVHAAFESYAKLGAHDLVDLSNVLDWMAPRAIDELLARCASELPRGAVILWRQLNHARDFEASARGAFRFDRALAARLLAEDRSLFYSSLHIGVRA